MTNTLSNSKYTQLKTDINNILETSKQHAQRLVNQQLVDAYWNIGKRITQENLTSNASYQNEILQKISNDLKIERSILGRAILFFNQYPEKPQNQILNWTQYRQLITIKDPIIRNQIETQAIENKYNTQQLIQKINQTKQGHSKEIIRPTEENYLYKAKIIKVVDADTLLLLIDLGFNVKKEQRVRLTQINAPELKTIEGQETFEYLLNIAANLEEIVIKTNKIDIFGRFLGDIFYNSNPDKKRQTKSQIFQNGNYLNQELAGHPLINII